MTGKDAESVSKGAIALGLRANWPQFSLLLLVNAFVGGMVGLERTVVPLIGSEEFHIASTTLVVSFIVSFGVVKALANLVSGQLADTWGRKRVLILGWLFGLPVPFIIMWAPSWEWVIFANALLGINQGLAWSMTVIMKIDLVGPKRRGLALGLNEFAGYFAVGVMSWVTGYIAGHYALRPQPFYLGIAISVIGLLMSILVIRETRGHVAVESRSDSGAFASRPPSLGRIFYVTSLGNVSLFAACQAGLVNNLNDGMAWGLFPLFFAAANVSLARIGTLVSIYPATWGMTQLVTGALSDRIGRKWLIVVGMWTQAGGIGVVIVSSGFAGFAAGAALLGIGTAMVYPTLLAAIGDVASPSWRASAVGVYRLWRDLGYAIGALLAGIAADAIGLSGAMWLVAAITLASGVVAAVRMDETVRANSFSSYR